MYGNCRRYGLYEYAHLTKPAYHSPTHNLLIR
jgi:hypothetical protein